MSIKNFILVLVFLFTLTSCSLNKLEEEKDPVDEIVGMYDCKEYLWSTYIDPKPRISNKVVEIRKDQNNIDYDFYVDGYWEAALLFDRVYDDVLYMKIYEMTLAFSSGTVLADVYGYPCDLADHPESPATFQIKKNSKLQVCYKWDNWRDVATDKPDYNGYAIWYYDGNKR